MKITARIVKPVGLSAKIKELKMPLSGGFEEGYKQGHEDGYLEGETAATEAAEVRNSAILSYCNAVLPTKGVETAETLEQVPQRIGEIPNGAVLLHRTEITEPVRAFSIDFQQEWKEYYAILIVPRDLKPNVLEWLCFKDSVDSKESYIGTQSGKGAPLFTPQHTMILLLFYGGKCYSHQGDHRVEIDVNKLTTLNFYTYYDPNTFDSGAVELYGVRHFIR